MLIRELVLHNFGGYRGRNVIDLTPLSPEQPVILFGGLNGAGKTTLLDSLQLVLYGKRARCAGRGTLGYDEYLRRSIHRGVADREGAAVEMCFDATFDDASTTFRVSRSWELTKSNGVREHLVVVRDEIESMLLAERWDELVEEIIPLEISSLFFFDGEKVEALADPERAGRVVSTAVESLLGLNLLDRLSVDLVALERRKRAIVADSEAKARIAELDALVADARAERARRLQEQAARRNELDRADAAARRAEHEYRREGGDLYEQRSELENGRSLIVHQLEQVNARLVDVASGVLPLRIVSDLLEQVAAQRQKEIEADRARVVVAALAERDASLLDTFEDAMPKKVRSQLDQYLRADREERATATEVRTYLHASPELDARLAAVLPSGLHESSTAAAAMLSEREVLEDQLADADRELAAVPSEDAIAQASRRREQAAHFLTEVRTRHMLATESLDEIDRELARREADLERAYREASANLASEDDAARIVEHASRVRATVSEFRARLLQRHLSSIEAAVLDSLRRLFRKKRLVGDIRIDPESFDIALYDLEGVEVPAERLSAGERQLLAVALLWGLARVSGRSLPTVIDTPLGRLDGIHRQLLAERYFPNASHQVLLLSTDEEIDEELLQVLGPAIGRTYELRHDDERGATTVVDGYFWNEASDVA